MIGVSLLSQLLALAVILLGISFQSILVALIGFLYFPPSPPFYLRQKKESLRKLWVMKNWARRWAGWKCSAWLGFLPGRSQVRFYLINLLRAGVDGGGSTNCLDRFGFGSSSWLINLPTPATGVIHKAPFRINLLFGHFHDLKNLLGNPILRWAALGDACFWAVGGFFYLVLVRLSGEVIDGKVGMGSLYGYWFLLLGVGIMAGALFAVYLNKGRVEIGLTPIGLLGMTFSLAGVYFFPALGRMFEVCCASLGFFGALFFVPLNGYLQDQAEPSERGRVLAASNLLTQLGGVL